ncbi:transcription elongation factor GreB [Oryzomonas rubra]|uniref:Transcription elongation factor GreB n=1 Tax=Oryzomonas rubra TaxID=2509454 RepID=A0A5A9XFK3_9BACT|nr:transcription elongation factor GreB [Oryzomonas rubra]KAA0891796.1 transcription elongation factor GreB [Oryzomonas rubra]
MTNLISPEGLKTLEDEFHYLWRVERPKIVQGVSDAAAEGDRSENAEYIYGKKRLREIDRKLKHLSSRLKLLKPATPPANPQMVSFGCWVTYEDEDGNERCYQLVGPDEFDVSLGRISIDSPVGQALLQKKLDDEVVIKRPNGDLTVYITDISATRPAGAPR